MNDEILILFAERLKKIRYALGLKQKDFAKSIGISKSSFSDFEAAKTKPNFTFLVNISKIHNVNLRYLLHGEGEMFIEVFEDEVREMIDHLEIPPIKLELLSEFRRLKDVLKPIIEDFKAKKEEEKENG